MATRIWLLGRFVVTNVHGCLNGMVVSRFWECAALGRLGQVAGLLLLVAGAGLAAWGAPYYMLDWGGTFVMTGVALASAGLSCALLGTVLVRLGALRTDIATLRAAAAVAMDARQASPGEPRAVVSPEPAGTQPAGGIEAGSPVGGIGTAGVAVASVAAGGLAVAAKSILTSVTAEKPGAPDSDDNSPAELPPPAPFEADDLQLRSAELSAGDRASLDDLLAKLALPMSDDDTGKSDAAAPSVDPADAPSVAPRQADADDLYARIDDAAKSLQAEAAAPVADPADTKADISMEQRIADEFADLRAELSTMPIDSLPDNAAPPDHEAALHNDRPEDHSETGVEEPGADVTVPGDAGGAERDDDIPQAADWQAEAAEPAEQDAARDDDDSAGETDLDDDAPVMPAPPAESEPTEAASAPLAESESPEAASAPPASSEGVVAAYNVGDTSYAMFVDGRIRVSTPDGQFMLESMDELKSFMAARRAAADAGSPASG
jgi:hypothetical protein